MKTIFEDSYVRIADNKITLLRDKFEYEVILKSNIMDFEIKKGFQNKRWFLTLIIGLGLLLLCGQLLMSINFFELLEIANSNLMVSFKSYFVILISIIIIFIISVCIIVFSIRRSENIYITYTSSNNETKTKMISLYYFQKSKEMEKLLQFLKEQNYGNTSNIW